ncbi:hypothetical protein IAT38_003689 [Cryptococcus sp. DSM 104549]
MRSIKSFTAAAAAVLLALPSAMGFSFSTGTPTQCGNFTVQWTDGTAPFHLLLVPTIEVTGGHIVNISIPENVTSPYSYSFTLEQPSGMEFLLAMSDAEGFGTGGTTSDLTVGSSDDSTCLPSSVNSDFFFSVSPDSNPSSCSSMSVTWPSNTTDPTYLYGLVPHGTAFQLPIDDQSTSYDWTVNIPAGTEFLLLMSDAGQYGTGGSTPLYTVQSGNTGCLSDTSPTSAAGGLTSTSSVGTATASVSGVGGSSSGGSAGDGSSSGSSGSNIGAIVGGTLGGVAFLVLLSTPLFFCLRRRARSGEATGSSNAYGGSSAEKGRRHKHHAVDLADEPGTGARPSMGTSGGGTATASMRDNGSEEDVRVGGEMYEPTPFRYPSPPEVAAGTGVLGVGAAGAGAGAAGARAGAGAGGARPPSSYPADGVNEKTAAGGFVPASGSRRHSVESSAVPATEASNQATLGHNIAGAPNRMSSIRKTPSSQHVGGAPSGSGSAGTGMAPGPSGGAGQGAGGEEEEHETRFVQHEDAGEVVDLPPRYDQLRARNPDQSA